jgi:hypothetical protein
MRAVRNETRKDFNVIDDLLYIPTKGYCKIYVPAGVLRDEMLRAAHDEPAAGHLGRARTEYGHSTIEPGWPEVWRCI